MNTSTETTSTIRRHRSTGALPKTWVDPYDGTVGSRPGVERHMKHAAKRDSNRSHNTPVELDSEAGQTAVAAAQAAILANSDKLAKVNSKAKRQDVEASLESAKVDHLRKRAQALKIPRWSKLRKDELVAAISQALS